MELNGNGQILPTATLIVAAYNSVKGQLANFRCDGIDDQVQIQAAIDALPAGGGKVIFLEGDYLLSITPDPTYYFSIKINRNNVSLEGMGMGITRFFLIDHQDCNIIKIFDSATNIHIEGISFDGNHAANVEPVAIQGNCISMGSAYVNPCVNVNVVRCEMKNAASLGLHGFGRDINVINCHVQNNSRQQIELAQVYGGTVRGCTAWNTDGTGNHGLGEDACNGVIISDCTIIDFVGGMPEGLSIAGGLMCTFANNYIAGPTHGFVCVGVINDCKIIGNFFTGTFGSTLAGFTGDVVDNTFEADGGIIVTPPATGILNVRGTRLTAPATMTLAGGLALPQPRKTNSVLVDHAYAINNLLAASANGNYSAALQPDSATGRNVVAACVNNGGGGVGDVEVLGQDQFGNVLHVSHHFAAAGTFKFAEVFAFIYVLGIKLTNLAGGDTISVGLGSKIGIGHKIFAGALYKVVKNGSDYPIPGSCTEDATNHAIDTSAGGVDIAAGDRFDIISLDCLA